MLTELRPNRQLLDPNFGGYKLSLDTIPTYRQSILQGVDHVTQSEDQFSFIHTKAFSLHNHLHSDPWHDNTVFFIDNSWRVLKARVNPETKRVDELESVWTIPHLTERRSGHFNCSLLFPTTETAVLADGCGRLHVLDRTDDTHWQVRMSSEVEGSLLVSARLSDERSMHCVLVSLETSAASQSSEHVPLNKPKPATSKTLLYWITLTKEGNSWSVSCCRTLEGAGSVDYVALEKCCSALYVCSNTNFKFTADSLNPLPLSEGSETMDAEDDKIYSWTQTAEDVKVLVDVGSEVTRDEVDVAVAGRKLSVQCRQQAVVTGTLSHEVDETLTTWTLQAHRLEVTLVKQESGLMWAEVIQGDRRGQQVVDPVVAEEVHSRLSHLCSDSEVMESGEGVAPTFNLDQLEECDSAPEDNRILVRLDPVTHTVTHQISVAGHQWLMSVLQEAAATPSVCLRHDVDGCVWRLDPPSPSSPSWPNEHVGTFCALGYVAASKQQKKFILAAPDLSYAVICESSSHVFVYRKASLVNGELRNRKTAAKVGSVSKQQLINLESSSPVLGASATNSHLFVLTSDTLYTFQIQ